MATTVTVKGQITIPKRVRVAAGIKPGDRVNVENGADGKVIVQKAETFDDDYAARIRALAARRLIRDDVRTDEYMKWLRGDPAEDPVLPEK